jgi:hypothetical protein
LPRRCPWQPDTEETMRSILLWLVGIPIPIIILLYLFGVF